MKAQVFSNDNSVWRKHYLESDYKGPRSRLLAYTPAARVLIERYLKEYFKQIMNDMDYAFVEFQLCTLLELPEPNPSHRSYKINSVANVLRCHPLTLCNDPDLPF